MHTATILAVVYHDSGRPSVAAGSTLAHSLGQGRPFVEYRDLRPQARQGREMTAQGLLQRFVFNSITLFAADQHSRGNPPAEADVGAIDVDTLARGIHECERPAIEAGMVAVVLDPPRPWIPFDALPAQAQDGRRSQARYLLDRFFILPVGDPGQRIADAIAAR